MSYDFEGTSAVDVGQERFPYDAPTDARRRNARPYRKDLEAIVTLLEIAALSLSAGPEATFTLDELIEEAKNLGGSEIAVEERDVKIVLEKARFIRKTSGNLYRLM